MARQGTAQVAPEEPNTATLSGSLGILCKSLLAAMAKELEQRALQALLPHEAHGNRTAQAVP